jgi:hypothetical protein
MWTRRSRAACRRQLRGKEGRRSRARPHRGSNLAILGEQSGVPAVLIGVRWPVILVAVGAVAASACRTSDAPRALDTSGPAHTTYRAREPVLVTERTDGLSPGCNPGRLRDF